MTSHPDEIGPAVGDPRQLERVAYHEAGHAVALILLAGTFETVSIRGDRHARGRVKGPRFPDPGRFPLVLPGAVDEGRLVPSENDAFVISLFAAAASEQRRTGSLDRRAQRHDRRLAARYSAQEPRSLKPYFAWASVCADSLIDRHWEGVFAVAGALLLTCTLTAAGVEQLLRASGGRSPGNTCAHGNDIAATDPSHNFR
jgi:hypothetical protein